MERYLLHFMLSMVAFSVSGLLANAWLDDLFVKNIEVEPPPYTEAETPKLTFNCNRHGIFDVVTSEGAFGNPCWGSDGSRIFVAGYPDARSKKAANRTFERLIKGASKLISRTPVLNKQGTEIGQRAFIKTKDRVKIVELLKVEEKESYSPYIVSEIEAPDFKHALAFENQQREARRSQRVASF
jgi:hypothetical protein